MAINCSALPNLFFLLDFQGIFHPCLVSWPADLHQLARERQQVVDGFQPNQALKLVQRGQRRAGILVESNRAIRDVAKAKSYRGNHEIIAVRPGPRKVADIGRKRLIQDHRIGGIPSLRQIANRNGGAVIVL
jgi:hypothetical protein